MSVSLAEAIQIIFGAIQILLAWLTIRRQSEPRKASNAEISEVRKSTSFASFTTRFDAFAFVVSIGSLVAAELVQPDFLLPWAQTLLNYFFVALSATIFTLTVVRVQAARFAVRFTESFSKALKSTEFDGGEF